MNIYRKITCCHKMCPYSIAFLKLVASTNRSVLHDIFNILEIGRNGKQYLNNVHLCLHFLQQLYSTMNAIMIQTITMITCTTNCRFLISCKSLTICSSSGILIMNNGGNVLLIEFALVEGMQELLVFIVINAVSIACIVFWYFIKNMISVITSKMSYLKATQE